MEFRAEKYVFSYLIPRISERTNQNVGDFRKNVGEFLKNVGVFFGMSDIFLFRYFFGGKTRDFSSPSYEVTDYIYKERHPAIK